MVDVVFDMFETESFESNLSIGNFVSAAKPNRPLKSDPALKINIDKDNIIADDKYSPYDIELEFKKAGELCFRVSSGSQDIDLADFTKSNVAVLLKDDEVECSVGAMIVSDKDPCVVDPPPVTPGKTQKYII